MIGNKFESGDKVRVIRNIRSDVNLAGLDRGELLIRRGTIGYVKSFGTYKFDEIIYQVHFVEQGITLGCRDSEVCGPDEPWDERQFERGDKVSVQLSLTSAGEVVVAKGDIGIVLGLESKEKPLTYRVGFERGDSIDSNLWVIPEKVLKLEEAAPMVLGRG
jgi:nitrogen fixation protein NifZ